MKYAIKLLVLAVLMIGTSESLKAQNTDAWLQFKQDNGSDWEVQWADTTGIPNSIHFGQTGVYYGDPSSVATKFMKDNYELFGFNKSLSDLKFKRVLERKEISHVEYQQVIQGIDIEDAIFKVHISSEGRVDMANGTYYPRIGTVETKPEVPKNVAKSMAREIANFPSSTNSTEKAELKIVPKNGEFLLVWVVTTDSQNGTLSRTVKINAITGGVLSNQDNRHRLVDSEIDIRSEAPELEKRVTLPTGVADIYPSHPGLSSVSSQSLPRLNAAVSGYYYLNGTYVEVQNDAGAEMSTTDADFTVSYTDAHFDEVNLYYHVDKFRNDYIDGLGFDGFTSIVANANITDPNPNAWYLPSTGEIYFAEGDNITTFDFAKEDKAIYHEYVHAVYDDIASGIATLQSNEEGAIVEGIPDYFAAAFSGRVEIAEYAYPSLSRDISEPQYTTLSTWSGASYPSNAGAEFFSSILWSIRGDALTSAGIVDDVVFGVLYRIDTSPTFEEFRNAMLAEDRAANNGHYVSIISGAFDDAGVGTQETDDLVTSIEGPECLDQYNDIGYFAGWANGGVPNYTYTWYYYSDCGITALPCEEWASVGSGTTLNLGPEFDFQLKLKTVDGDETVDWSIILDVTVLSSGSCSAPKRGHEDEIESEIPIEFSVSQNYPNPFNPSTNIEFSIPQSMEVSVNVYDVLGKQVAILANGQRSSGSHSVTFDASHLPSGMYYYHVIAEHFSEVRAMSLIK